MINANTVKTLVSEMMEPKAYMEDAELAADFFNAQITRIFDPKAFVGKARVDKGFGHSLDIEFAGKNWEVTPRNSPQYIKLVMHLTNNSGKQVPMENFEIEALTMNHRLKNVGVKFRKIKSDTPLAVVKKVLAWFKKNAASIKMSGK